MKGNKDEKNKKKENSTVMLTINQRIFSRFTICRLDDDFPMIRRHSDEVNRFLVHRFHLHANFKRKETFLFSIVQFYLHLSKRVRSRVRQLLFSEAPPVFRPESRPSSRCSAAPRFLGRHAALEPDSSER